MGQYSTSAEDQEKIDPKTLATRLRQSFSDYYATQKAILVRRKLDVAALRSRANIVTSNVPLAVQNIIGQLYK